MFTSIPAFIGGMPGGMEFAIILLLAVLLFGANKIPKLARSTGQAMGEFQKGRETVEQELEDIRTGKDKEAASADSTDSTDSESSSESSSDNSSDDSDSKSATSS